MTIQLLPHDTPRDVWLAARHDGIGASEIAAVMGISPWESPFSLYWRKVNEWQIQANAEMNTGTFLEPTIVDWFTQHCDPDNHLTIQKAGLYAHKDRPWQMATPDRLILSDLSCSECGGWGEAPDPEDDDAAWSTCTYCDGESVFPQLAALLECKWVAATWDGWGEENTDQIPVYYRAQCLWQMDVMGVDEVFVAALGPSGFRSYRVRRDEADLKVMREYGRRFMQRLETAEPPGIDDHSATLAVVKRLHPDVDDVDVEIPADLAAGYRRAQRMKRLAEQVGSRYAVRLRAALGTGRRAVCDGRAVASRSVDNKLIPARSPKS